MIVKCLKDSEGWWTEGEVYPATVVAGGFIQVGDDDDPNGEEWGAAPVEYREDGSILYQVGGLEGEVLFEESTQ
ncbi:hypothetical protein LPE90_001571 [Salmonella enterica]|uniref:Uncharacterized protein n=2 Tax=Salmonella enterica TaxID=28901 RepID=A0A765EEV8_SALER|nr:hypothetical protein [Salmonella enterica]EBW6040740.1 hypothetical protein [Salmonella enterica subsp. enterica serovar Oranienburg]EBR1614679.1 hypothetical protein [Salmonella enterica]EED9395447.1 hypothetical protein [Salmonella enterica subsp. enterica serovar Oranienburg]EEK4480379.1 hypothetical protein [Salmonella enterica]